MPSSDSEDFESADEGNESVDKSRKKGNLSNYSENPLKTAQKSPAVENTDGWDDFEIDESETLQNEPASTDEKKTDALKGQNNARTKAKVEKSQDSGWDDFDDWGQDGCESKTQTKEPKFEKHFHQSNITEVTDRLSAASTNSGGGGGWSWGWHGMDNLLSSATAGITNLTNQVSQGISTVLETSIGAPDPAELAKQTAEVENVAKKEEDPKKQETECSQNKESEDVAFPFGSLISGVTKFVETTGSKVISSGLDTLETIGKKTMEVLQDGDPGLTKKRAMLGLDPADKPVLSQVLREAKARADEEDRIKEEKREAKEVHYENLFDDFEGLVHLEALEMLSLQVNMRIQERMRNADPEKRQDIKETLQQVAELCEMPEEETDDDDDTSSEGSRDEAFHERLQTATQDLGLKLHFQPLVKQYKEILEWHANIETDLTEKAIYKRAVSGLAQATALSVELYHKAAEMLLVKTRRSTADESDALTQMTVVLTKHVSELATLFTEKLNSISNENKDQINTYITNVFLEAGNSSTYIQNAFQLALPILQIGAV